VNKTVPSLGRLAVMIVFAFSCFAIVLYLWVAFGGSVPLAARGYRVSAPFPQATNLAPDAEVRIAGVKVGLVKTLTLDEAGNATKAVLEIEPRYAPLPADTRAMLRQKTLLGETYVELTPGSRSAPRIPDGGSLPAVQVADTVQLDQILRTFDPSTRSAFRTWLQQEGSAVEHRGPALNAALANLAPFAQHTTDLLDVLNRQSADTRALVRDTGIVFDALNERDGQLADLVSNSNRVFQTTASRDQSLAETFRILPTFLDETRLTTDRLTAFARDANPLVTQLRPAALELSPTLIDLRRLAPDLEGLFRDLGPLITVSARGVPAAERFLREARPLLRQLDPFLSDVNPILRWLGLYKREIAAFFALDAASAQAVDTPPGSAGPVHYLRTANPLNAENLAAYPTRIATNRPNPYVGPGESLARPGKVFGTYACGTAGVPTLAPSALSSTLGQLVETFALGSGNPAAPPCVEQAPLGRFLGQSGKYPHVLRDPTG
jgi:phospholipid/cholesterol/gamma-HCH transport system substrate-binding protein